MESFLPSFVPFALVIALAVAGWAIAERFKVPAAGFLGPLLLVGAGAILGLPQPVYPDWSVMIFQVIFGAFLGCQADRDSVARVRALGRPVVLATFWTILSAFAIALLLAGLTQLDMTSSFLSAVPGGVAEMSAMSISMGANTAIVAAMQSLRVIATMAFIPLLVQAPGDGRRPWRRAAPAGVPGSAEAVRAVPGGRRPGAVAPVGKESHGRLAGQPGRRDWREACSSPISGCPPAASSAPWPPWPSAGSSGLGLQKPPPLLRLIALLGMGSYVGTSFSAQTLLQLRDIALPAVLVTAATVASGLALARVLREALWHGRAHRAAGLRPRRRHPDGRHRR